MSKISEPGYLFIHSGVLEKEQIEQCFQDISDQLKEMNPEDYGNIQYLVNVVKTKKVKNLVIPMHGLITLKYLMHYLEKIQMEPKDLNG